MSHFKTSFLGRFQVLDSSGSVVEIRNRKTLALLLVIVRKGTVDRSYVSDLLWSGSQSGQRLASLRQALAELRRVFEPHRIIRNVGKHSLEIVEDTLLANLLSIESNKWHDTIIAEASSGSEFLLGLDGIDAEFDDWLYQTRSALRNEAILLLEKLIREQDSNSDSASILAFCDVLKCFDPYSDLAVRTIIEYKVKKGDIAYAAQAYIRYKNLLNDDLQVDPQFDINNYIDITHAPLERVPMEVSSIGRIGWHREEVVKSINSLFESINILNGKAILISGPSGVGKSFTVDRFIDLHARSKCRFVRTSGGDYAGGTASTLLAALEHALMNAEQDQALDAEQNDSISGRERPFEEDLRRYQREGSVTGSHILDELVLRSVEGTPFVLIFDDVHRMTPVQLITLNKILLICESSYCFAIILAQKEPKNIEISCHQRIRLATLSQSQIREYLSTEKNILIDSNLVSAITEMTLGLPMLIQRAIDYPGNLQGNLSLREKSAHVSSKSIGWNSIDEILNSLLPKDRVALARVVLVGGRIGKNRYEKLFGESVEGITGNLVDYGLIDGDEFSLRDMLILSHEIIEKRCRAIYPITNIFKTDLQNNVEYLCREELSAVCGYLIDLESLGKSDDYHEHLVRRLAVLDMWNDIVSLVEAHRGHHTLSRWVEQAYLHALFKTRKFTKLVREFSFISGNLSFGLEESYSKACAFVGVQPEFGISQDYASSFYRGDFKKIADSTIDGDDFEAHGYRAMALAQIGNFPAAHEEVTSLLRLASILDVDEDRHLAEFFRQYVLTHQGEFSGAVLNLRRSLMALRGKEENFTFSLLSIHLGFVLVLLNRPEAGLRILRELYESLPIGEAGVLTGYAETALTSALIGCGYHGEASIVAKRSLQTAKKFKLKSVEVWALRNMFRTSGNVNRIDYLTEAIEIANGLGMRPDLLHLTVLSGTYHLEIGEEEVGNIQILEAKQGYKTLGMRGVSVLD